MCLHGRNNRRPTRISTPYPPGEHFRDCFRSHTARSDKLGTDGAYFRVSNRIEIGTAVIDMLYESPLYMAEGAGAADLIAGRGALPGNRISEET
jgi:hypothetical protein